MKNILLKVASTGILVTASQLSGQVLMLNFGSTSVPGAEATNSPYHSENPTFTESTWNELGKSDSSSLVYADNTSATGIAFDIGRSNPLNSGPTVDFSVEPLSSNTLGDDGGVYSLTTMRSTVWSGNNNTDDNWVAGQITGLTPGQYEVLIWGNNGNADLGQVEQTTYVTSASPASTFDFTSISGSTLTNGSNSSWSDGVSYVKTTVTVSAGESLYFAIDGTRLPSFDRAFLSGVQVASIPEPTTYALIAGGAILTLAFIRRRRFS